MKIQSTLCILTSALVLALGVMTSCGGSATTCQASKAQYSGCNPGGAGYCPQCDPANPNMWVPKQTSGSTGTSFCVDPATGARNSKDPATGC